MRLGYYLFAAVLCIWFLAILCRYVFALCLSLSLSLSNEISSKKYAFANVLNHYGNIYYNILNGMALKLKFEYHKKVAYTQTEAYAKCSCPTDMTAPSQLQHDVCYGEVHIWPRHSHHSIIMLLIPQQIFREARFGQHEILKKKRVKHFSEIASS